MTGDYNWSQDGRMLLETINILIESNGGREKFARDIQSEWRRTTVMTGERVSLKDVYFMKFWTPFETVRLIRMIGKGITHRRIGEIMDRNTGSIEGRLRYLKAAGKFNLELWQERSL
jgi:hypothetical protein